MSMLTQRDQEVILKPDGRGGYVVQGYRLTELFSTPNYDPHQFNYLPPPDRGPPAGQRAFAVGVTGLKWIIALLIGCALYSWLMHGSSGGTGSGTGKAVDHTATGSINSTHGAMNPPPPASGNSGGNNGGAAGPNNEAAPSSQQDNIYAQNTPQQRPYYPPQPQPYYPPQPIYPQPFYYDGGWGGGHRHRGH